jgi:hypothetical protein
MRRRRADSTTKAFGCDSNPEGADAKSGKKTVMCIPKAKSADFLGRFREIVSDPLNLLIERTPKVGVVEDNLVCLHKGHRVSFSGSDAYYGEFSQILVINRGVHEPLEEYAFQQLLKIISPAPSMLELGAYWGHYSMWLKKLRPQAIVHLVEQEREAMKVGMDNFERNGYAGEFLCETVGQGKFAVDNFMNDKKLQKLDILHADIQGAEVEMLKGCAQSLARKQVDYLFVSTHSNALHREAAQILESFDYRIEVSSDYELETTSYDGFILGSSPLASKVFSTPFHPLGRIQIASSKPKEIVAEYLGSL